MIRDRDHYLNLLDRNPNATIGFLLAAKMVVAATKGDEEVVPAVARRLKREYGEALTNEQVRAEMGIDRMEAGA
jgi:hypothetical protein